MRSSPPILALGAVVTLLACGGDRTNSASADGSMLAGPTAGEVAPPDTGAAAATPAEPFDCANATTPVETYICGYAPLARMDREVNRLYQLGLTGKYATPARSKEFKAGQQRWLRNRDGCGAGSDLRACLTSSYALRIQHLRVENADARTEDDKGISMGPVGTTCDGLDAGITTSFVSADPNLVVLEWLDQALVLSQDRSGSGARYSGKGSDGAYSFWTKGDEAIFERPGHPAATCTISEIG